MVLICFAIVSGQALLIGVFSQEMKRVSYLGYRLIALGDLYLGLPLRSYSTVGTLEFSEKPWE